MCEMVVVRSGVDGSDFILGWNSVTGPSPWYSANSVTRPKFERSKDQRIWSCSNLSLFISGYGLKHVTAHIYFVDFWQ
jgi:hypothetical protein